jgi:hypothetical protein
MATPARSRANSRRRIHYSNRRDGLRTLVSCPLGIGSMPSTTKCSALSRTRHCLSHRGLWADPTAGDAKGVAKGMSEHTSKAHVTTQVDGLLPVTQSLALTQWMGKQSPPPLGGKSVAGYGH